MSEWQRPLEGSGVGHGAERTARGHEHVERARIESRTEEHLELRLEAVFAAFRARLIALPTMGWPLRLLAILVIALVVVIGALIGLRDLIPLGDARLSGGRQVPLAILIGVATALALAWSLLLTAALHARWYLRFPALAAFTALAFPLMLGPNASGDLSMQSILAALAAPSPTQYAALALLWLWGGVLGLLGTLSRRRDHGRTPERAHPTARFAGLTLAIALGAILVLAAPLALPALAGDDPAPASIVVAKHIELVFLLLVPAFLLAGMHFADSGHEAAAHLAAAIARKRATWPLVALTAIAAAGICVRLGFELPQSLRDVVEGSGVGLVAGTALLFIALGVAGVLLGALLIALVGWLGRLARWPKLHVPTVGVLGVLGVLWLALLAFSAADGGRLVGVSRDAALVGLGLLLLIVALGAAIVLAMRGGSRAGAAAITALFALVASLAAPYLGLRVANLLPGIELLVAPATLAILPLLAVRRGLDERTVELVRLLFVLNVGLQVVDAVGRVYLGSSTSGGQLSAAQGILFVFAFLWHLLLSGEHVTNVEGRVVPRYVRVLAYLGYSVLLSTVTLFLATASAATTGTAPRAALALIPLFDNHLYARAGLELLGVPLLLTMFVLGVARWRQRRGPSSPAVSGTRLAQPPRSAAPMPPAASFPRAEGGPRPILPPGRHTPQAPQTGRPLPPPEDT